PSLNVAKRNETMTALQALALLNNPFMVRMSEHFAERASAAGDTMDAKIDAAFDIALGRRPSDEERCAVADIAQRRGLANACRLILNLNEFVFVD
ncbi:MAG: DUF1553 domain-containing protein, partial [Planctomycetales bacterium]|nr:DUF1553 domain-containing protein [Planctomycetales bacterium]